MPIIVAESVSANALGATLIKSSYLIKDKTKMRPTQILSDLLFHRTAYDCTASVNLAVSLTLWDVMKYEELKCILMNFRFRTLQMQPLSPSKMR